MRQHSLAPDHVKHFLDEGFTTDGIAHLEALGVCTLEEDEALQQNFQIWNGKEWISGRGIYFPFTATFGQLRLDNPIQREDGSIARYLTPHKASSEAFLPEDCRVITEGYKDAQAGCLHGEIPTGAIAGVSHYKKALPEAAGYTVLFDADGWSNHQVFRNLFNAGLWLKGKIQLLPIIEGEAKAGLCEYFQAGYTASDYRQLIADALSPKELLMAWPNHWQNLPDKRLSATIETALDLAAQYLDCIEQETILNRINKATKTSFNRLRSQLQAANQKHQPQQWSKGDGFGEGQQQRHREWRYAPAAKALNLPLEYCVTAQAFDGWTYHRLFAGGEGEWMCNHDAFFHYTGNGAWSYVEDGRIRKLIADESGKAYKLSYSKHDGWVESYPYERDKDASAAFRFSRTRLLPPLGLPANTHLTAFKNCTVDLRTGRQMEHDPAHRIIRYIPYDYQPDQDCPEVFRNFIASAYGLDLLPIIRAFTSMFLDPTAPYGRFPHLIGASGSGKGTLGRFWSNLLGEGAASISAFSEISSPEGRYQHLTGKSICGIPDVGGYQSGLRAFYELVDNGALSGRALFSSNSHSHHWNVRFWLASVDYLVIENAGDGWERRAYPIPTLGKPEVIAQDLHLKLQECMADVISWALAMPRAERDAILLKEPTNKRVKEAIFEAKLHGDSARVFVNMCLRPTSSKQVQISKQDLHSRYVIFCRQFGYQSLSYTKFNNHVKTFLPQHYIKRHWEPGVQRHPDSRPVPEHWGYLHCFPGAEFALN